MSQAELAERLGIRQQSVSAWITGEAAPRTRRLPAIAAALGVSLADLLPDSSDVDVGFGAKRLPISDRERIAALERQLAELAARVSRLEVAEHPGRARRSP
jgi:transcriptional regulator with XRE-family HTH domain